jgi:hypothetical protein
VTLGAASVRIRALFADSSIIGYSTRWVWSNEGDRTPTLERFYQEDDTRPIRALSTKPWRETPGSSLFLAANEVTAG